MEVNRAAFDSWVQNATQTLLEGFARWPPSQKEGGKSHLAKLPAKSVLNEKHPKWVQIDLPPQELKICGE